jgi:hypothetical protein
MLSDFEQTSQFVKRPKDLKENLVFTDVNFVFDPDDVSLRSVGKIGVAMIGKKVINKKLEGYIEIQYKGGNDVFTIYLQTGTKGWMYFEYRPGELAILSSYDDINNALKALSVDKRKIKGSGKAFYLYTAASPLSQQDFLSYMKDKAAGISRVHPVPREPLEEIPVNNDTSSIPENTAPAPGDTLNKQEQKQQDEINEINQLKQSGGNVLSGPPPGRAPAPAKQDSVPVTPQTSPDAPKQDAPAGIPENTPPVEPKKDTVPAVPKSDAAPPVVPQTTPDVPKTEAAPVVPVVTPDAPKKDTVAVTPPVVVPDVPKTEAAPPPVQQAPPVTAPVIPQATHDVPKTSIPSTPPPVVPDVPKQDSTAVPH